MGESDHWERMWQARRDTPEQRAEYRRQRGRERERLRPKLLTHEEVEQSLDDALRDDPVPVKTKKRDRDAEDAAITTALILFLFFIVIVVVSFFWYLDAINAIEDEDHDGYYHQ